VKKSTKSLKCLTRFGTFPIAFQIAKKTYFHKQHILCGAIVKWAKANLFLLRKIF